MPIEVLMPALSPTMTEGNLAKWHKKEGDKVKAGDVLAEIETDKATMEMEAVDEGTLGRILVPEGAQGVKVNQPIAVILGEGEDAKAIVAKPAAATQPAPAPHRRRACPAPRGRPPRRCAAPAPQRAEGGAAPRRPPTATTTMAASSPARSRGAWRSRVISISRRFRDRGRTAASSRRMSKAR